MSPTPSGARGRLRQLVAGIDPLDAVERAHADDVRAWLGSTDDVYRRVPPRTPPKHLAAYAVLHDETADAVLLLGHRRSRLWLPAGGHVEVDEDPGDTAAREAAEELGFTAAAGPHRPLLLTVTETAGPPETRHVDVTFWYVFGADASWTPSVDAREADGARWWSWSDITRADPSRFDPHLGRCLDKLRRPA